MLCIRVCVGLISFRLLTPIMAEHATVTQILEISGGNGHLPIRDFMPPNGEHTSANHKSLLKFNISGQEFLVSTSVLGKHPDCLLSSSKWLEGFWRDDLEAFYFDRDPVLFNSVLNLFRYDALSVPNGYNNNMVLAEICFWKIPIETAMLDKDMEEEFLWMEGRIPPHCVSENGCQRRNYQFWCFLTDPLGPYTEYRRLSLTYTILTMISTVVYVIIIGMGTSMYYRVPVVDSDKNITMQWEQNESWYLDCQTKLECFTMSEPTLSLSIVAFIFSCVLVIETLLRLCFCPDKRIYFRSVFSWIDLFSTICILLSIPIVLSLSMFLSTFMSGYLTLILQAFQVLRLLKIFQYMTLADGLLVIVLTLKASVKELCILAIYLILGMFIFSTLVFYSEVYSAPNVGIPDSLIGYWWAVVTMTTVGYGDFHPGTAPGYVVGTLCALSGLILTSLPVAVIGGNFNRYWEHNEKRKKIRDLIMDDST